ncbi:hypothetical protein CL647_02735 [bacterium]|nr:hypothetical protein [Actinomycetota bacterium]MBE33026.1 hypothetical protein [bacterium]|tara:strand:- start:13319 stop:14650 length:1332 start_codon:yes stop_codon:yes gene_type:complete
MQAYLQKKKSVSLSSFLKTELLNLLPFQDDCIVIELLESYAAQIKEFKEIRFVKYTDKQDSSLAMLAKESNKIMLDINSNDNAVKMVVEIQLEEGVSEGAIKQELEELRFFIAIFIDRIQYIEQLYKKNNELEMINSNLKKINKLLKRKLKNEMINQYENYDVSRSIIKKEFISQKTKQLCHEINNPLSLIQFDVMSLEGECQQSKIDSGVLELLATHYKIEEKVSNDLINIKTISEFEQSSSDYIKKYPMLSHYVGMILKNKQYHHVNNSNKIAIKQISAMVSKVIEETLYEGDQYNNLDMNKVVKESMAIFKHRCQLEAVELLVSCSKSSCYVHAKKVTLVQIIINIVKNSLESMRDNIKHKLSVKVEKKATTCLVTILDTGSGFSDLDLSKMMRDPDQRVGLGIAIIKSLVNQLNGSIKWEKREQGTLVSIKLPLMVMPV